MPFCCPTTKYETQVLVIGNGPAGIAMSAFLSGMHPFYDARHPHENPAVHEKLMKNVGYSILDQDLSWSYDLNELSQAGRPLSVLYDMLVRPGADMGQAVAGSIQWEMLKSRAIPNMVIGETKIGGSWNEYDPEMLTVSFSDWLDMPGFSMEQWLGGIPLIKRLPSVVIAKYLKNYVERLGIRKNFHCNFKVLSIKKCGDYWMTEGRRTTDGRAFLIKSKSIVIASGKTSPRKLGLENEENCQDRIVYDVRSLKERIDVKHENSMFFVDPEKPSTSNEPVVVVGDGISSVDCVRHCLENDIQVVHVIRRNARQLRTVMMSRLSPIHYSEYTNIYRMMIGRSTHPNYQRFLDSSVTKISPKYLQITEKEKKKIEIGYSTLAVCIGRESHFDEVFDNEKHTFLDYRCQQDDTLYAVGAYAGDHFVRFLVGGCLRVAQLILGEQKHLLDNNNHLKVERCKK